MLTVGLTGGIACGKSLVSRHLSRKGAVIIDLDLVAREIVKPGMPAWFDIRSFFGPEILLEDGSLDRKKLSHMVFSHEGLREKLNQLTHGRIIELVEKRKKGLQDDPGSRDIILVIEAPLLFEAGMKGRVDKVIVVKCQGPVQQKRLKERDGITGPEALGRIHSQMPLEEKVRLADYVIDNSYSPDYTREQVDQLWEDLVKLNEETNRGG